MRIALVGGVERNEATLVRLAEEHGHTLVFHGGHMKGRGVDEMRRLVERADVVIVTTDVNSHNAVHLAKRFARLQGTPYVMARSCNPSRLRELLAGLGQAKAA